MDAVAEASEKLKAKDALWSLPFASLRRNSTLANVRNGSDADIAFRRSDSQDRTIMKAPRPPIKPLTLFTYLVLSNAFFVAAALLLLDPWSAGFWFLLAISILPAAFLTWAEYHSR